VPSVSAPQRRDTIKLEGFPPNPKKPTSGCPFQPCCPRKIGAICEERKPPLVSNDRGHAIACHIPWQELVDAQTQAHEDSARSL
jgi:peptide/nickel transport system ATP-binding protein